MSGSPAFLSKSLNDRWLRLGNSPGYPHPRWEDETVALPGFVREAALLPVLALAVP